MVELLVSVLPVLLQSIVLNGDAAYKFPKAQERLEELKRGGASAQKNRERLSRSNPKQVEKDCVVM